MTLLNSAETKNKKTIGFFINELHHRYQSMILPGIIDSAKKRNYNLIAFVGKSLNSPSAFDNQENLIYNLADCKCLDGLLILSGAIGNYLTLDELTDFCLNFRHLPTVCIATPIKGIPSVWVNNKKGMREIVEHFVKHHKFKRIAFIRGPDKNPEADLRFKIFSKVLKENNLPLYPELIVNGNFVYLSGMEGIKTLLDKRKVKFDALLAANDEMLIGAYRELTARKIKIPDEVALGGFDNIDESKIVSPQITTVYQPLYKEGFKAVEMLADIVEGKSVPELVSFPSRLITRSSCGCNIEEYKFNILEKGQKHQKSISAEQQEKIYNSLINDMELQSDTPREYKKYKDSIKNYLSAFISDLLNSGEIVFLNLIKKLIDSYSETYNLDFFRILVNKMYIQIYPLICGSEILISKADYLFNNAHSMLLNSTSRKNKKILIQSRDYNWAMLNVTKTLSTTFDLENLRDIIIKLLPTLNISFCFIALYNKENGFKEIPAPESTVFINYQADKPDFNYSNKIVFNSVELIPDSLISCKKNKNLVIFPLVTENDHFGYIVFDHAPLRDPIMYEALQGHISASLKGASLLETVKKQSKDLSSQKDKISNTLKTLRVIMGGFINSMSLLVEARDPYTAGHQVRVANLARTIATEMGLPKDQIEGIRVSGVLHDLGKLYIPSQILNKPGKLMDVEFSLIKIHPQIGYNILKSVSFPWPVADIILQHHERIDGSGYPTGLKADEILIEAQIICVADVVEAMASHRPYRPALGIDAALEEIKKNRGKLYNPEIVDCCIRIFKENGFKFNELENSFNYPLSGQ
jgi:putative nucleotidyltransferase with HDIG domain